MNNRVEFLGIRLLAVDIDGTLTGSDRRLNLSAVEALRRVEERGIPVTLASGNILHFVEAAAIMIGLSGPIIAEDGGVVFDPRTGEMVVLGDRVEVDRGLEVLRRRFGEVKETRNSPSRLTGATIYRTFSVEEVQHALREAELGLAAVDSGFAIHLRDPEVNKGRALRVAAGMRGVQLGETAAIADGPNDVELLRSVGLGIAVGNAPTPVKKVAKLVVEEPDGKGVVEAVELILGL